MFFLRFRYWLHKQPFEVNDGLSELYPFWISAFLWIVGTGGLKVYFSFDFGRPESVESISEDHAYDSEHDRKPHAMS